MAKYNIYNSVVSEWVISELLPIYDGGEFPYKEYCNLLRKWAEDNPIYFGRSDINIPVLQIYEYLLTNSVLKRIVTDGLLAEYPAYLNDKIKAQMNKALEEFKRGEVPSKNDFIKAMSWFLCPSAVDTLNDNIVKFDSFVKHLCNTLLNTDYEVDPTMLIFYSSTGHTGKTYRIGAIQEAVESLGFPSTVKSTGGLFSMGYHDSTDYNDGLMTINEWTNNVNIDDSLLKSLIEQNPITVNPKFHRARDIRVNSCIIAASNYRLKTGAERRTSVIEYAEKEYITDKNHPEYISKENRKLLFEYILKVYYYFNQTNKDNNSNRNSFLRLFDNKTLQQLNSKKINSNTVSIFTQYLSSMTFKHDLIKMSNFVTWVSRNNLKYSARDLKAILTSLKENGYVEERLSRVYHLNKSKEEVIFYLLHDEGSDKCAYDVVMQTVEDSFDLSFLPDKDIKDTKGSIVNDRVDNVAKYITNYLRDVPMDYDKEQCYNILYGLRRALKKDNVKYTNLDLIDFGFSKYTVLATEEI